MLFSTLSSVGVASAPALRIVGPGYAGRSTTIRSGNAMVQDATLAWQEAPANTPRFQGAARRLLIEGERQNFVRNPRGEGSRLNISGALPTYWTPLGTEQVERQVIGTGEEDGLPYVDIRFFGKASASGSGFYLLFESTTSTPATQGEIWTASVFARLVGGNLGTSPPTVVLSERTAAGAFVVTGYGDTLLGDTGRLATQRLIYTRVLSEAGAARVVPGLFLRFSTNEMVDMTLRLGAPQLERSSFASSPILPPAGAPAAMARSADAAIWLPAGGFGKAGTVTLQAMLPQAALFGSSQGLIQIDDGTDQNRLLIRNSSGGATVYGLADSSGTTLATLTGGDFTARQPFRVALAWSPGVVAFCLSGQAVQTAAITPPSNLYRMLIGHASGALNQSACGEIELIDYHATRLSDSTLQAITVAP